MLRSLYSRNQLIIWLRPGWNRETRRRLHTGVRPVQNAETRTSSTRDPPRANAPARTRASVVALASRGHETVKSGILGFYLY